MSDSDMSGFISLAELAASSTDDVAVLLSRVPNAGIFRVKGKSVSGKQAEPVENKPPLIRFGYVYTIMSGKPTDKNVDIETLIGRDIQEAYTIWPDQLAEIIGLLKGRYQKVGLPNSGMKLGGVEGMEPGWLDTVVGHEFDIKITTGTKDGVTRAYYDWLAPPKQSQLDKTAQ